MRQQGVDMEAKQHGLLITEETANMLRKTTKTLDHWALTGQGPPWARIGRRRYYRRADVEAWIDAQFDRHAG